MKKIFSVILIVVCVLSLVSCWEKTYRGIDEFHRGNSDFSLCAWLIPNDFLEIYDNYVSGDYFFYSNNNYINNGIDKTLMYLVYEEDIYEDVKQYVFDNMTLDIVNKRELNGYVFYENLSFADSLEYKDIDPDSFPYQYNMVAINDEKKTVLFFGLIAGSSYENIELGNTDFAKYLEVFYGEYYSFE